MKCSINETRIVYLTCIFFETIGSHIKTIQMVLQKQADAAAVDANCLSIYMDQHPEIKEKIFVLESWGPLPPYPIVINTRLSSESICSLINRRLDNMTLRKQNICSNLTFLLNL